MIGYMAVTWDHGNTRSPHEGRYPMLALDIINFCLGILFFLCYVFQFVYLAVPFAKRMPEHKPTVLHTYAVLICARNESAVIGDILDCLQQQDYPADRVYPVVIADNCTDDTAQLARDHGARVYERQDSERVGKGYALDYALTCLDRDFGPDFFDGYLVFDADNLMEPNYITEINRTFSDGYDVVASYRNSKNYGDNWLSAGIGLWFLRDSHFMNGSRMRLGICCQIAGTGFLFSRRVKEEYGGWPFHLLTEDYELTACSAARGMVFGYCEQARFYDEQTTGLRQSWRQRIRWCKGGIQVLARYGRQLLRGIFSKNFFSCYDMTMCIAPAFIISMLACIANVAGTVIIMIATRQFLHPLLSLLGMLFYLYVILFFNGLLTTLTEWRHIHTTPAKKILYCFTFPIFMFTFFPIALVALFARVEWKPIAHSNAVKLADLHEEGDATPSESTATDGEPTDVA